jgi:hypothetical protein
LTNGLAYYARAEVAALKGFIAEGSEWFEASSFVSGDLGAGQNIFQTRSKLAPDN